MYDFELFTIGAGSGGVAATRRAGGYGTKAAICEEDRAGGTCVLRGCIPKKFLVYASHVSEQLHDAGPYGWEIGDSRFQWAKLIENKNTELDRLNGIYNKLLADNNVELIAGRGRLIDAHTVEITAADASTRTVTAETILVATGGWPVMPLIPGIEHAISSNEALDLPRMPKDIVVVGGGYIAVEFAGIFNHLGANVTQIIRRDLVLRGFDDDIRQHLQEEMARDGVNMVCGSTITAIEKTGDRLRATLDNGETLDADEIMYATGRAPNTRGIGLEDVGVDLKKNGAIKVDEWSRTSVPNIYSVGDCTDRVNLTPVAITEGRALVDTLYNNDPKTVDYADIPTAVFSQPPIGTVGLTEAEARDRYGDVALYKATFRPLKGTISGNPTRTMMKMIVDPKSDRVVGCHMVGDDAAEMIQGLGVAIKAGATKAAFDATVGIHPTSAEEWVTMYQPAMAAE